MASDLTVQTIRGPGSGANANRILIPSGQTLVVPNNALSTSGIVRQVVTAFMQPQLEGSLTSATDCFSCSITPTSASSRILVLVNMAGCGTRDTSTIGRLWLAKGPSRTVLTHFADYLGNALPSGAETYPSTTFLDSPSTTSQVDYYVRTIRTDGSTNVYINHYRGGSSVDRTQFASSTMTLIEIS